MSEKRTVKMVKYLHCSNEGEENVTQTSTVRLIYCVKGSRKEIPDCIYRGFGNPFEKRFS